MHDTLRGSKLKSLALVHGYAVTLDGNPFFVPDAIHTNKKTNARKINLLMKRSPSNSVTKLLTIPSEVKYIRVKKIFNTCSDLN